MTREPTPSEIVCEIARHVLAKCELRDEKAERRPLIEWARDRIQAREGPVKGLSALLLVALALAGCSSPRGHGRDHEGRPTLWVPVECDMTTVRESLRVYPPETVHGCWRRVK